MTIKIDSMIKLIINYVYSSKTPNIYVFHIANVCVRSICIYLLLLCMYIIYNIDVSMYTHICIYGFIYA